MNFPLSRSGLCFVYNLDYGPATKKYQIFLNKNCSIWIMVDSGVLQNVITG